MCRIIADSIRITEALSRLSYTALKMFPVQKLFLRQGRRLEGRLDSKLVNKVKESLTTLYWCLITGVINCGRIDSVSRQ